jgi:hypothetical protein
VGSVAVDLKKMAGLMKKGWSWEGSGGASVQPDWNQNDPNAADYVKGRTHWDETNEVLIDDIIMGQELFPGYYVYMVNCKTFNEPVQIGAKCVVSFNDETYVCTMKGYGGEDGAPCLGNQSMQSSSFENTGEPFFINNITSGSMASCLFNSSVGVPSTMHVKHVIEELKPLDPKFLPEDHINSLIDTKLGVIENGTY